MRIAHAVARTVACAYVWLGVVACAPHDQPGPFTAVHVETTNDRVVLERVNRGPSVVDGANATLQVDVERSRNQPHRVGRALTIAGGATMGVAAFFGIIALATLNTSCNAHFCFAPAPLAAASAGIVGGTGLLMLIPGVVLMGDGPSKSEPTKVQRVAGLGLTGIF